MGDVTRHEDERGAFEKLFSSTSAALTVGQICVSFNQQRGTVRGLHLQVDPYPERKTLWCSSGRLFDVFVDTRPDSPTCGHWAGVELVGTRPQALHLPPGVAHGYQTLEDETSIQYLIDGQHVPDAARTILWDDPDLDIQWPLPVSLISDADRAGTRWTAF